MNMIFVSSGERTVQKIAHWKWPRVSKDVGLVEFLSFKERQARTFSGGRTKTESGDMASHGHSSSEAGTHGLGHL